MNRSLFHIVICDLNKQLYKKSLAACVTRAKHIGRHGKLPDSADAMRKGETKTSDMHVSHA